MNNYNDSPFRPSAPVTRRELLRQIAIAGAAAAIPAGTGTVHAAAAGAPAPANHPPAREALEALTASEADLLEAIVARLIPTDANGPGAAEARAAHYIDRALAGPNARWRADYAAGLGATDAYARMMKGRAFGELAPAEQDQVLREMEANTATGFPMGSAAFFELVRTHTIEGTLCDPYYGGNAEFVGWDLIGYPGIRLAVSPDDQRMRTLPERLRRSAYDDSMFSRGKDSHGH